jgi:hypothetical protein
MSLPLQTGSEREVNETKTAGLAQTHTTSAKIFDKLAKHNTLNVGCQCQRSPNLEYDIQEVDRT